MTTRSPLHYLHQEQAAKFVDFGGWEMPVSYGSVLTEHKTVRSSVGWFDVSHLGRFSLSGPGASAALLKLFCNNIELIPPGRTQYTMMLNDQGGVMDDIIVWRWAPEHFWILPNAANHQQVMEAFRSEAPQAELTDLRPLTVALAIQGPAAPELLNDMYKGFPSRGHLRYTHWIGRPSWLGGTGYTGERGGEVVLPKETAVNFVQNLLVRQVPPIGLGARDTLRLEAGLPLWGQDLDPTITPLEAGMGFAVDNEHTFVGQESLSTQQAKGVDKQLIYFRLEGRVVPRQGYRIRTGNSVGEVTSGNFSPMLEQGIGMGYLSPPPEPGEQLEVEIRGEWLPAVRVKPPFYRSG